MLPNVSRRTLFGASAAGAALVAGAGTAGYALADNEPELKPRGAGAVPFWAGDNDGHQAGIVTPAQDHLHFASLDVITEDREELDTLLREWTHAAARMTEGKEAGKISTKDTDPVVVPPADTGEALDLPPSELTITVGFGASLFDDRFGLADKKPDELAELPAFQGDNLKEEISGGDICIQACANDPQVAVHAVRNLVRLGKGVVSVKYAQLGFGRTASTSTAQKTPRNLMGFKDGTNNIKAEKSEELSEHVWVDSGPSWMHGGSFLVTRRIRMFIEMWDSTDLEEQQNIFARFKHSGAPLTEGKDDHGLEFEELNFDMKGRDDEPVLPADSHVRLAHPDHNGGAKMLRRGYNFVDGSTELGTLDAGLFFMAYQKDPRSQFVPVQRNLSRTDVLNEYIGHVGSGVWAIPPGATRDQPWHLPS